ncbi:MAG: hypothetical protein GXY77_15720 [Fibrobacter sp.]|nr:hypothetical protein [Fibrobacter sp.]
MISSPGANNIIPSTSAAIALQHHELQDGSGYPRGIKGENRPSLKDLSKQNMIHWFAEVVSVADVYNSLTYRIPHEKPGVCAVNSTIRKLTQTGEGISLNSEIVKILTNVVSLFPVGTRIKIIIVPLRILLVIMI